MQSMINESEYNKILYTVFTDLSAYLNKYMPTQSGKQIGETKSVSVLRR
jgi:hypothetical protein